MIKCPICGSEETRLENKLVKGFYSLYDYFPDYVSHTLICTQCGFRSDSYEDLGKLEHDMNMLSELPGDSEVVKLILWKAVKKIGKPLNEITREDIQKFLPSEIP